MNPNSVISPVVAPAAGIRPMIKPYTIPAISITSSINVLIGVNAVNFTWSVTAKYVLLIIYKLSNII